MRDLKTLTLAAVFALGALKSSAVPISGGSTLLTSGDATQLETWRGGGPIALANIFTFDRGSGLTSANFHSAADNQGDTFTVISSRSGQIFGGYNPLSWDATIGSWVLSGADREGFLFNLTTDTAFDQRAGALGQYQAYNTPAWGPVFGGGFDLYVSGNLLGGGARSWGYGSGNFTGELLGSATPLTFDVARIEVFRVDEVRAPVPEAGATAGMLGLGLIAMRAIRRKLR